MAEEDNDDDDFIRNISLESSAVPGVGSGLRATHLVSRVTHRLGEEISDSRVRAAPFNHTIWRRGL